MKIKIIAIVCVFWVFHLPASAANTESKAYAVELPQHGKLILQLPISWKKDIRQPPGNFPPTMILSPAQGDEFQVLITPLWSPTNDPEFNTPATVKRTIAAEIQKMLPTAVEEQVSETRFTGVDGPGYYFLVTDKAPKTGEYPYAVRAGIGVGDLLLSTTILLRSKNSASIPAVVKALATAKQQK